MKLLLYIKKDSYYRNILLASMIFFSGAVIFMIYIFSHLSLAEFLYPHDGPNSLSISHIYINSFVRNFDDGGISTAFQIPLNSVNLIAYYFFYSTGLSLLQTQFIFFTLIFFLVSIISYIGFYKILMRFYPIKHNLKDFLSVFVITLFYNYSLLEY